MVVSFATRNSGGFDKQTVINIQCHINELVDHDMRLHAGCSPDHPLLIWRGGEKAWVHACDVVVGDQVVVKNYTEPMNTSNGTEALIINREMI